MVRTPRDWSPGTTYHVTARGNRKQDLFHDDEDRKKYLLYLQETKDKYPFTIHAYCLMPNHIHLLIETHDVPLEKIIRSLHTRYAVYFNKKYDYVGHVFQGRYGSTKIDTPSYFIKASRYIHQNPVEGKLTIRPESYPWSSYPSYIHSIDHPLLSKERTLNYFPVPQVERYKKYVVKEVQNEALDKNTIKK
ncbi:REP-associated tyrosine transposase [Rossellomorea sp. YZS02]|uniref:REP-associated tyrosine transposase n=1 Tax=Rossellomorea sp. YZS02 TaxID=3097358 RepID=UPI002A0F9AB9|nr:transposase [Rossellomorea sp. YZS02]MDX8344119.1 transposase [Rossellomorea sp. YZS02]